MAHLRALWTQVRGSLWFLPSLIVSACVAMAIVLVDLEGMIEPDTLAAWPRVFGAGAEGARGMLTTIAGSMITVAGVVFSITMVVLSLTSSQYTSRVLRRFLEDRSNQLVLGVFVGIYAYCLVVLRTIRGESQGPFVPSIAILGAIVLAFLGIGVLIHFIHHISNGMRASNILANIASDTFRTIDRLFPTPLESDDDDADELAVPSPSQAHWEPICAPATGYLQSVDIDALSRIGCDHDAIIRIEARIGDFLIEDRPCATAHVAQGVDRASVAGAVRRALVIGSQPSIDEDATFGFRQIVDVGLKALSPASNDSTTARMCLDHLSALLIRVVSRKLEGRERDHVGASRVVVARPTFSLFLSMTLEELRLAAHDNPPVLAHLIAAVESVASATLSAARIGTIADHLPALADSAAAVTDRSQRIVLTARVEELRSKLASRAAALSDPPRARCG